MTGRSLRDGLSSQATEPKVSAFQASIPSADTLEAQLQDLLIRKGIRQITVLEPDAMCPARFAVIRIGYPQRGVGDTLSEAYADCGVLVQ